MLLQAGPFLRGKPAALDLTTQSVNLTSPISLHVWKAPTDPTCAQVDSKRELQFSRHVCSR